MKAHRLISAVSEALEKFQLPHGIPSANMFMITDNIGDVDEWRAKVILGNSMRSGMKKGMADEVGYVMVSIRDNTIVPIARSDEHQTGYELMYGFYQKKYGINPRDYISIFASGNNYASEDGVKDYIEAYRRFLSYGGKDLPVSLAGDYSVPTQLMSSVVRTGKFEKTKKGQLAPIGKIIVQVFENCAKALDRARGKMSSASERAFYDSVRVVYSTLKTYVVETFAFTVLESNFLDKWWKNVEDAIIAEDIDSVEEAMFSFGGIKNTLHNNLRKALSDKSRYSAGRAESLFGDVELAVELLARM